MHELCKSLCKMHNPVFRTSHAHPVADTSIEI